MRDVVSPLRNAWAFAETAERLRLALLAGGSGLFQVDSVSIFSLHFLAINDTILQEND